MNPRPAGTNVRQSGAKVAASARGLLDLFAHTDAHRPDFFELKRTALGRNRRDWRRRFGFSWERIRGRRFGWNRFRYWVRSGPRLRRFWKVRMSSHARDTLQATLRIGTAGLLPRHFRSTSEMKSSRRSLNGTCLSAAVHPPIRPTPRQRYPVGVPCSRFRSHE